MEGGWVGWAVVVGMGRRGDEGREEGEGACFFCGSGDGFGRLLGRRKEVGEEVIGERRRRDEEIPSLPFPPSRPSSPAPSTPLLRHPASTHPPTTTHPLTHHPTLSTRPSSRPPPLLSLPSLLLQASWIELFVCSLVCLRADRAHFCCSHCACKPGLAHQAPTSSEAKTLSHWYRANGSGPCRVQTITRTSRKSTSENGMDLCMLPQGECGLQTQV